MKGCDRGPRKARRDANYSAYIPTYVFQWPGVGVQQTNEKWEDSFARVCFA